MIFSPGTAGHPDTVAEGTAKSVIADDRGTILIADDEILLSELIRIILEGEGYNVLEAHSGVEAIEVARVHSGRIDLLLTDILMSGGTNGLELAATLGSLRPGLKVLYMSAYTADLVDAESAAELHNRLLKKPFAHASLLCKVREILTNA